jgi:hypothetical protein
LLDCSRSGAKRFARADEDSVIPLSLPKLRNDLAANGDANGFGELSRRDALAGRGVAIDRQLQLRHAAGALDTQVGQPLN